jgi:hypothetical protein
MDRALCLSEIDGTSRKTPPPTPGTPIPSCRRGPGAALQKATGDAGTDLKC